MKAVNKLIAFAALGVILSSCATTPKLTQQQIQSQYPPITQLDHAVQAAQVNNVDVLAPQGYKKAERYLNDAYKAAQKGQTDTANTAAKQGLDTLEQAKRDASGSADILAEVMEARGKALKAGAQQLYPKDLRNLEEELTETANLVEKGNIEKAKQQRPELRQAYADLELKSVKEGTIQRAKAAISRAKDNDAHRLAPKTFKSAQESLAAAVSILEADRTARDRAEAAAQQAVIDAERSETISEMVRDFDRRDSTPEDVVLWHQEELSKIAAPLNKNLTFNEPNKQTVAALQQDIAALVNDRERLAAASGTLMSADATITQLQAQHKQEISRLKQEQQQQIAQLKSEFAGEKTELTEAQQQREERFKRIQQMFSQDEATVFRQGDNVLISVHGFKFPPGSSEIQPQNFGIMNKIVQGISAFNASKVQIAGHTDATGSNEVNKNLSEQRAQNVARFLTDVGHIPQEKVVAEGYGSQKPVATNATPEGRAENRRIEVLIVNE